MADTLSVWLTAVNAAADPVNFFQWGSVAPASAADKFFRVKNNSAALTANDVSVSVSNPGTGTEDVARYLYLSLDGLYFSSSVNLGSLPPGAISRVITLRRVVPSTAQASGFQFFDVVLSPSSWGSVVWPSYPLVAGP